MPQTKDTKRKLSTQQDNLDNGNELNLENDQNRLYSKSDEEESKKRRIVENSDKEDISYQSNESDSDSSSDSESSEQDKKIVKIDKEDLKNQLFVLCKSENPDIEALMQMIGVFGVNVNTQDHEGNTCLHYLYAQNPPKQDVIEVLLELKANPNIRNYAQQTPQAQKIDKQDIKENRPLSPYLIKIVEKNDLVETANNDIDIELHEFCRTLGPNDSSLKSLIERKLNFTNANKDGTTPLHYLCNNQNVDLTMLCRLFKTLNKSIVNQCDAQGNTYLHYLCQSGFFQQPERVVLLYKAIDDLLKKGANPNIKNRFGQTCLHLFSQHSCVSQEIFKLLLEKMEDLDAQDENGHTVLHYLCMAEEPDFDLIYLLKDKKANFHLLSYLTQVTYLNGDENTLSEKNIRKTPLHYLLNKTKIADDQFYAQELYYLLQTLDFSQETANMREHNGETYLHYVCVDDACADFVQLLLEKKADPNIKNYFGYTPLTHICDFLSEKLRDSVKKHNERNEDVSLIKIIHILLKYGAYGAKLQDGSLLSYIIDKKAYESFFYLLNDKKFFDQLMVCFDTILLSTRPAPHLIKFIETFRKEPEPYQAFLKFKERVLKNFNLPSFQRDLPECYDHLSNDMRAKIKTVFLSFFYHKKMNKMNPQNNHKITVPPKPLQWQILKDTLEEEEVMILDVIKQYNASR